MAEVKSNMPELNRKFEKAVKKALRLVGGQAERAAKELITDMKAVDTGFLRNSITFALADEEANIPVYHDDNESEGKEGKYNGTAPKDENGEYSVYIGTNVYYAPYIEYGTRKMPARPFLSQSILQNQKEFKELFKDAFDAFL